MKSKALAATPAPGAATPFGELPAEQGQPYGRFLECGGDDLMRLFENSIQVFEKRKSQARVNAEGVVGFWKGEISMIIYPIAILIAVLVERTFRPDLYN